MSPRPNHLVELVAFFAIVLAALFGRATPALAAGHDAHHAADVHHADGHPGDHTADVHEGDGHEADSHAAAAHDEHDAHGEHAAADAHGATAGAADHAADHATEGASSGEAEGEGPVDPELDVDMHGAPPATDAPAYGAFLRAALGKAREHVIAKLEAKALASQAKSMDRFTTGLGLFSMLGIFLAIRPLFLLKKYPGRGKTLIGYGFLSAFLFSATVNVFAMVLGLLRAAQSACGQYTNPQMAIVEAAFDILDHRAEDLAVLGPRIIEPSLHKVAQGDASFVVVLLENLKGIKGDIGAIVAIAKAMKSIDWIFGYIPIVLTIVAVVTFALSAKDTLLSIVRLPETVVEGGAAGTVVKAILRRIKGELFATLCLIGGLVVLTLLGGMALRAAVLPAVESFLGTVFLAAMYIQVEKVSSLVLFGSLALAALVLVLNIAVVLVTTSATLGKLHKILQRKFHDGVPLSAHGRFWKRAPLAIFIGFLFPLAYDFLSEKGVEALMAHALESKDPSFALALVGSPALLVGGFILFFAACYGVHSLLFLFRYPAKTIGTPALGFAGAGGASLDAPAPLALMQPLTPSVPASVAPAPPPFAQTAPASTRVPARDPMPMFVSPSYAPPSTNLAAAPKPVAPAPAAAPATSAAYDELAVFDKLVRPGAKSAAPKAPEDVDMAKTTVFHRSPGPILSADATVRTEPVFADVPLEAQRRTVQVSRRV